MRRLVFLLGFSLVSVYLYGQDYYMYVNGQKRTFAISTTKLFVKSETLDTASLRSTLQKVNTDKVKNLYIGSQLSRVDLQNASKETVCNLLKQWNAQADIAYTSPVFVDESGKEIGALTNQVFVRLKSLDDYSLLATVAAKYKVKTIELADFDVRTYTLTLDKDTARHLQCRRVTV